MSWQDNHNIEVLRKNPGYCHHIFYFCITLKKYFIKILFCIKNENTKIQKVL